MNRFIFLISHLHSGSLYLHKVLDSHPVIQLQISTTVYSHIDDVRSCFESEHKWKDASKVYGDHLFYNHSFNCAELYKFCHFFYVIRQGAPTLNDLVINKNHTPQTAYNYYTFRLRRICEMARKTPNRLIITWDGIKNKTCASVIENYLKLRTPLPTYDLPEVETKKAIDNAMAEKANDYYEKTLYYLTNLSKTGR